MAPTRKDRLIVIGGEETHLKLIERTPSMARWDVVPVLDFEECQPPSETIDFDRLYEKARAGIDALDDLPTALIGYYDFPVTSLVALLRRDYGLAGATPEAVATCENKYWMRCEQKKVMPDSTPRFAALNPFDPDGALDKAPPFPFWLKPVKGHSSVLGFKVENEADLDKALHACRQKIHLFGGPFNQFLAHLDVPDAIAGTDGNFAIAEEMISAPRQFTLEGYVFEGETEIYGAVDSLRAGKSSSSLSSYQYPADLPDEVIERCRDVTHTFLSHIGFDGSPFNVEFFWDPRTGALNLLEINPRISKSHAPLFLMVDGASHQKVAAELSAGERPEMPYRQGKEDVAGKFMLRSYEEDGIVVKMPSDEELAELQRILPDVEIDCIATEGTRLSDMPYQDSYSYELADLFLGGDHRQLLEDAYRRCLDSLTVLIKPLPEAA